MLFDVTRLLSRGIKGRLPTGIDRVDLAYLEHYGTRARAVLSLFEAPVVLSKRDSLRLFDSLVSFRAGSLTKILRAASSALTAFGSGTQGSVYLNTGHSGLARQGFARSLLRRGVRPVWMVHDLIPITHPEYCRAGEEQRHRRRMRTALQCASALIVNSRATESNLRRFAVSEGLETPLVQLAPLAPALSLRGHRSSPLEVPYFLVVATIEPRKNLAMLLQLWRRLVEAKGDRAPRLVVVGQRGWECENVVDLLERSPQLKDFVIERGDCDDDELASWLAHARALLFPSFVEGYGLPLVEALQFGTPVIASDLPVFRETARDIPEYLDPLDGVGWLAMIERYAEPDSCARRAQLVRMQGFRAPTWSDHFAIVDRLIAELAERPAASAAAAQGLAR